jgi:hypothetical protein
MMPAQKDEGEEEEDCDYFETGENINCLASKGRKKGG